MFLIRSAFLLFLLVMLLPSDPREQARLYQTASQALHHAATFCDRNGAICREAQVHWATFKDKLAVGSRMAIDLVNERISGQPPGASLAPWPGEKRPTLERSLAPQDTLKPADRTPAWRLEARAQL